MRFSILVSYKLFYEPRSHRNDLIFNNSPSPKRVCPINRINFKNIPRVARATLERFETSRGRRASRQEGRHARYRAESNWPSLLYHRVRATAPIVLVKYARAWTHRVLTLVRVL